MTKSSTLKLWLGELLATACLFGLFYVIAIVLHVVQP